MFGLSKTSNNELLTSSLHDQNDFYDVLVHDLRRARREVIVESPFLSLRRIEQLMPTLNMLVSHRVHIIINTKPPYEQEQDYQQQAELCIAQLQDAGVDILFTGGHHRKLAIIDRQILYEGSLNILSQYDSCEVMRRVHSEQLAIQMTDFIGIDKFTEVI